MSGLVDEINREKPDVVIVKTTIENEREYLELQAPGYETYAAKYLLSFEKRIREESIVDFLDSKTVIRDAQKQDFPILRELIANCYEEHRSHYHRLPFADHQKILEGYIEWTLSFFQAEGGHLILAEKDNTMLGFMALRKSGNTGSFPIGGVKFSVGPILRHKILCDLGHVGEKWMMKNGCSRFQSITQIDNYYTQKLLYKNMHSLPQACLATIHILRNEQ